MSAVAAATTAASTLYRRHGHKRHRPENKNAIIQVDTYELRGKHYKKPESVTIHMGAPRNEEKQTSHSLLSRLLCPCIKRAAIPE